MEAHVTPPQARYHGVQIMRRNLLAFASVAICLLAASVSHALPDFSEPQPVSEPEYGHNGANAYHPVVASNGSERLVLWNYNAGALFATQFGPDGPGAETVPFVVANGALEDTATASNGEDFLVVWRKRSNQEPESVWAAMISEGAVQGQPRKLSSDTRIADDPDVAWNGTSFLVTWGERDEGSALEDIIGLKLDRDGSELDAARFVIWESTYRSGDPAVASNGDGFLVAWEGDFDRNRIHAARVSADWEVLDNSPIALPADAPYPRAPDVGSDGNDYLVAWSTGTNDVRNIAGVRVESSTGDVPDGDTIRISEATGEEGYPRVGFDGSRYVVVWQNTGQDRDNRHSYLVHVGSDGTVSPDGGKQVSLQQAGSSPSPSVAGEDDGAYAVWLEERFQHRSVYGSKITQDGTIQDPERAFLSPMPSPQRSPVVAASDDAFLVVWQEQRGYIEGEEPTSDDLYGMRFSHDGTQLDDAPFEICHGEGSQYTPSVASNGEDFVVTWSERLAYDYYLSATQVRGDTGEVVTPCGIQVSNTPIPEYSRLASNGSGYFVVWQDEEPPFGEISPNIYGAPIVPDPCGTLEFGERVRISESEGVHKSPEIASNGDGYLIVWEEEVGSPNYSEVYAARIGADANVLAPGGVPVVERTDSQNSPSVASDGDDYLVLWSDSHQVDRSDIHAARFGADGQVVDAESVRLSDERRGEWEPAATFDGQDYVVMWGRNALGLNTGSVVALSMTTDAELADSLGGTELEFGRDPQLATTSGGMSLAVWSRTSLEQGLIRRVVVSPFGVDSDGDGIADALDEAPDTPQPDKDDSDECGEPGDDVGVDAGSDAPADSGDESDVSVWESGEDSAGGCRCSSSDGTPPWGGVMLWLVAMVVVRVRRMSG